MPGRLWCINLVRTCVVLSCGLGRPILVSRACGNLVRTYAADAYFVGSRNSGELIRTYRNGLVSPAVRVYMHTYRCFIFCAALCGTLTWIREDSLVFNALCGSLVPPGLGSWWWPRIWPCASVLASMRSVSRMSHAIASQTAEGAHTFVNAPGYVCGECSFAKYILPPRATMSSVSLRSPQNFHVKPKCAVVRFAHLLNFIVPCLPPRESCLMLA